MNKCKTYRCCRSLAGLLMLMGASCATAVAIGQATPVHTSPSPRMTLTNTTSASGGESADGDSPHYTIFYPDAPNNKGSYTVEGNGMPGDRLLVRLATAQEDKSGSTLLSVNPCKNSQAVGNDYVIQVDATGRFSCTIDSRNENDADHVVHNIKFGVLDPASLKSSDLKSFPNELVTVDYKVEKYPASGSFTVDSPSTGNIAVPAKIAGKGYPGADVVVATSSITSVYCVAHVGSNGRWECPDRLDVDYTQGDGPTQLTAALYLDGYKNTAHQKPEEVINRNFNLPPLKFGFTTPAAVDDIAKATPVQVDTLPSSFVIRGMTSFIADSTPIEVNAFRLDDGKNPSDNGSWTFLYSCYADAGADGAWSCNTNKYPFNLQEHGSGYYAFVANYPEYASTQIVTYMRLFDPPTIGLPQSGAVITEDEMAVEGMGQAGDVIAVSARGSGGETSICSSTQVDAQGQWECAGTTPASDGAYSLIATQTLNSKPEGQKTIGFMVKHDHDDPDDPNPPPSPPEPPEDPKHPKCQYTHSCPHGPPPPPGPPGPGPYPPAKDPNDQCPTGSVLIDGLCHKPKPDDCPKGFRKVGNSCEGPGGPDNCPSGFTYDDTKKICIGPIPGGPDFWIVLPPNGMPLDCGKQCQAKIAGSIPAGDTAVVSVFDNKDDQRVSGPYSSQVDGGDPTRWQIPVAALKPNATLNIIAQRMHNGQMVTSIDGNQLTQITTPAFSVDTPTEGKTLTAALGNMVGLAGQAMPGSKVKVTGDLSCDTAASIDGSWSCQAKVALPVKGSYWISATDSDASGHALGEPIERNFYVHKDELTLEKPISGQTFSLNDSITYAGQATPGSVIQVNAVIGCSATATASARWSCGPYSLAKVAPGDYVVTVSDADDPSVTGAFSVLGLVNVVNISHECHNVTARMQNCTLVFKVIDDKQKPLSGKSVAFSKVGDITLQGTNPGTTDRDGKVTIEATVSKNGGMPSYGQLKACVESVCSKPENISY